MQSFHYSTGESRGLLYGGEYETSFAALTEGQKIACQIVLRMAAGLSIGGSGYVVYNLLGPRRESELYKSVFSRLLLGLCVADVIASVTFFLGSWPIPADSLHSPDLVWNVGTQLTCDMQGFIMQTSYYASIFYTASLSVNFLLRVKYEWTEEQLRKQVEPYLHGISLLVPLALAIVCLVFDLYNPTAFFCYVTTYPIGCDLYSDVPCVRGNHTWMWRSIAQIVPFAICLFTILYCMIVIYRTVREQERAVARYSAAWVQRKAKNSRLALQQASQYIGAFLAVWTPLLIVGLCHDLGQKLPFGVWLLDAFVIPIVGLLNGIVYSRMVNPIETVREYVSSVTKSTTKVMDAMRSSLSLSALASEIGPLPTGTPQSQSLRMSAASSSFQSGACFIDDDDADEEAKREEAELSNPSGVSMLGSCHDVQLLQMADEPPSCSPEGPAASGTMALEIAETDLIHMEEDANTATYEEAETAGHEEAYPGDEEAYPELESTQSRDSDATAGQRAS